MGFRFYKRVKIAPGVSINISKSGPSLSFGPRGMKHTVGPRGTRTTFGIPGTGIYYTTTNSKKTRQAPVPSPTNQLDQGFFKQLFYSEGEKNFIQGLKFFLSGNLNEAFLAFQKSGLTDGDFMCGFILLGKNDYIGAERYLLICQNNLTQLGSMINKINQDMELLLNVTEYIEAPIHLDRRGLALSLVEAYQHQNKYSESLQILTEIWNDNPSDKIVCLSLTDVICMSESAQMHQIKDIIELTKAIENEEPIDTNILYLRSYGLYRLDLLDAAIEQLTGILRRTKNRPDDLMIDIRYLRGQMYEVNGQLSKAKKDYQLIYSKNPSYEDIADKLGL